MMAAIVWPFLIYYILIFVACYIMVEFGQDFFYGEPTPGHAWKVALGALILAGLLTWTKSNYATMFTSEFMWTALQGIAWFAVFVLVFRFHPWHGAGIGLAAMLLLTGTATLVVDSMLTPRSTARIDTSRPATVPVRRPAYAPPPKAVPAPAPK